MKKFSLLGLAAVPALMLAACSVGDTDEGNTAQVSNFENLPKCSPARDAAGMGYLGMKFLVEEEELYYLCTEKGWIPTDATPTEKQDAAPREYVIENAKIEGSVSAPGVFVFGSPVKLREIKVDSVNGEIVPTGNDYLDEISSSKGEFVIPRVSLYNDFALVEVSGLYKDMFTGEVSDDTLSLQGIVDLSKGDAHIDLLSLAAYERAKVLVKKGYDLDAAVSQATKEFWTAFGFTFVSVDEYDAAMLAFAVLLHGNGDEKDFVSAIEAFNNDFAEDGAWDDEETKAFMADFAFNLENNKIKDDDGLVIMKESDIRRNLETFGVTDAPAFETFVTAFWNNGYGLGSCGAASENAVRKNAAENSDSTDAYFTCSSLAWRSATDFERDTVGLGNPADGTLMKGNVDTTKVYAFDTTGWDAGTPARWAEADSIVLVIGYSCTEDDSVANKIVSTKNKDDKKDYYACNNRKWVDSDENTYKIGYLCNADAKNVVEKVAGEKKEDTKYYRCTEVVENVWSWAPATEVDYITRDEECVADEIVTVEKEAYVCTDSEKISFRKATEVEKEVDAPCTALTFGNERKVDKDNYSCVCSLGMDFLMPDDDKEKVNTCKMTNNFTWKKKV